MPESTECNFYIKRILKTNVAVVFKMNTQIVDVIFNDSRELIFDYHMQLVTFITKEGKKIVQNATGMAETKNLEFLKYLKYVQKLFQKLAK